MFNEYAKSWNRKRLRNAVIYWVGLPTLAAIAIALPIVFLGIGSPTDIRHYWYMSRYNYHPIWKDLAIGRFTKGDSLQSLITKHPPLWREDFPPFTVLNYSEGPSYDWLSVCAKDDKLICATAGSCTWKHQFFDSPTERAQLDAAYIPYIEQNILESKAYRIHTALLNNQNIFLANVIQRQNVPMVVQTDNDSTIYANDKHYGPTIVKPTIEELTVEVTNVLHGDMVVGAILRFPGSNCCVPDPNASDAVFLHFEDGQMIFSHWKPEEYYLTVPKEAYDWYSSLTEEEVKEFEARFLARLIRRPR